MNMITPRVVRFDGVNIPPSAPNWLPVRSSGVGIVVSFVARRKPCLSNPYRTSRQRDFSRGGRVLYADPAMGPVEVLDGAAVLAFAACGSETFDTGSLDMFVSTVVGLALLQKRSHPLDSFRVVRGPGELGPFRFQLLFE